MFQHQTSLRQISVLATEPFVGLLGPNPSLEELLAKQIPQLPALSATAHRAWTKVSPEVADEGAGTRFPHPWDVLMWFGGVANYYVASHHSILVLGFRAGVLSYLMNLLQI